VFTGASTRNWASCGEAVTLPAGFRDWQRQLLTDPQTSGGLLVACDPADEAQVLQLFRSQGFASATTIGTVRAGAPGLSIHGDLETLHAV
jgi:selenide,water dikinase